MLRLTSAGAAADAVTSASFTPAAGPPPSHPVRRQPTPPPAVTSANFGTPLPPMTTGTAAFRREPVQKQCASVRGAEEKVLKTYCRVSITEESFRSVVLKPVARRT
ncbi:unnamed protein product [Macrosiphum euphorbiae]|uniref:Uncharacterized protein n=1 Tax=Macrosiphum euphorbiae TaxID=13131 RepID=A0AAV0XMR3_9HEMI|nr:unnamed protein product [Macrosiphum euphorbiae]